MIYVIFLFVFNIFIIIILSKVKKPLKLSIKDKVGLAAEQLLSYKLDDQMKMCNDDSDFGEVLKFYSGNFEIKLIKEEFDD